MYEKLNAVAASMQNLKATLAAPDSAARVGAITEALDEAARELSDAAQATASAQERAGMQKMYRGMIAAKRIVAQLHDLSLT